MADAPTEQNGVDMRGMALRSLASALMQRHTFAGQAGLSFPNTRTTVSGFKRDLYYSLGYPDKITAEDFRWRYERGDIAERIVEAYPRATWAGGASIQEDQDPEVSTPFETAVNEFFDEHDVWARLLRADILSNLGQYSVLLIGAEGDLSQELPRLSGPDAILYLSALPENRAKIKDFVEDATDRRFGLPESYTLNLGDEVGTKPVHHSRVLHIAEGLLDDDVYGKPRLRAIWNRLMDLEKLVGAGSEAAWKRMDPGMAVDLDPEAELDEAELDEIADSIEEYVHGLTRVIQTRGTKVDLLTAAVAGFGSNVDSVLQFIAATTGIPKRILTGSERGELASTQDDANWNDRVAERRREFAVPVVRAFIGRLVEHGALPEPADGNYEVVWPDTDELDEAAKAEVVKGIASANQSQALAGGGVILTSAEIRDTVYGLEPLDEEPVPTENEDLEDLRAASELADDEPDEPEWKAVHRAADSNIPRVARVAASLWASAASLMDADELEAALADGDASQAALIADAAIDEELEAFQGKLSNALHETLADGARAALRSARARGSWFRASSVGDVPFRGMFEASFDADNPRAVSWADARAAELLTEVLPETRAAVRALIQQGLADGIAPHKLAQQVRQIVGLRTDQLEAITNLAAELRSAEPGSLVTRFPPRDGVRGQAGFKARVPKGGASESWIEGRVAKYRSMQHNYRARLISRTETVRAANAGVKEAFVQAQENGQLPEDAKRVLIATMDERTRPAHAAANGQIRGLDEPFDMGDGTTEPGQAIHCRCAFSLATPEDLEAAS